MTAFPLFPSSTSTHWLQKQAILLSQRATIAMRLPQKLGKRAARLDFSISLGMAWMKDCSSGWNNSADSSSLKIWKPSWRLVWSGAVELGGGTSRLGAN